MNDYDIAVLMKKDSEGMWEEENYYYAKQQPTMVPDGWIIVVTDDGVVKQYRYLVFLNMIFIPIYFHKENIKKIILNKNAKNLKQK